MDATRNTQSQCPSGHSSHFHWAGSPFTLPEPSPSSQCPSGHSSHFHNHVQLHDVHRQAVSMPFRAFVSFPPCHNLSIEANRTRASQCPSGHSSHFHSVRKCVAARTRTSPCRVSMPFRAFVSFPHKKARPSARSGSRSLNALPGIRLISTSTPRSWKKASTSVSMPFRAFVSFPQAEFTAASEALPLSQCPSGHSSHFHRDNFQAALKHQLESQCPSGHSSHFHFEDREGPGGCHRLSQCPSGHSSHFHEGT